MTAELRRRGIDRDMPERKPHVAPRDHIAQDAIKHRRTHCFGQFKLFECSADRVGRKNPAMPIPPAQQRLEADAIAGDHRYLRLVRTEEHTAELQSLMRISYAVF